MLWRRSANEIEAGKGEGNLQAMKDLFDGGEVPGLLATKGDHVVGWIEIAPRSEFPRLASSQILKPIDQKDLWGVSCFFIDKKFRREGLPLDLLTAAVDWARTNGATIVEGYPIDIARTKEAISERHSQILQIEESYRAEVLEQLPEVRSRIAQLEEQKIATEDELTRVEIRAPRTGYVHQLAVHTIGGVVAPAKRFCSLFRGKTS